MTLNNNDHATKHTFKLKEPACLGNAKASFPPAAMSFTRRAYNKRPPPVDPPTVQAATKNTQTIVYK